MRGGQSPVRGPPSRVEQVFTKTMLLALPAKDEMDAELNSEDWQHQSTKRESVVKSFELYLRKHYIP